MGGSRDDPGMLVVPTPPGGRICRAGEGGLSARGRSSFSTRDGGAAWSETGQTARRGTSPADGVPCRDRRTSPDGTPSIRGAQCTCEQARQLMETGEGSSITGPRVLERLDPVPGVKSCGAPRGARGEAQVSGPRYW